MPAVLAEPEELAAPPPVCAIAAELESASATAKNAVVVFIGEPFKAASAHVNQKPNEPFRLENES